MPQTYEPITKLSVTSGGTTFNFTSIPQTYSDLRLVIAGYGTATGFGGIIINGSTSAIYGTQGIYNSSNSVSQNSYDGNSNIYFTAAGDFATSYPNLIIMDFINYTNTSYAKTGSVSFYGKRPSASGNVIEERVFCVNTTSAISAISHNTFTLAEGSEVSLWGILRA